MLSEEQLKHYKEEGYMILEDFFSEDEIDTITDRLDIYDGEMNRSLQKTGHNFLQIPDQIVFSPNINQRDVIVQAFIAQSKFAELSTSLLGPDIKLHWDQSVYKRPEATRDFPWHQDNSYQMVDPEHYLTCWLALSDATVENGCIWIRPRSHLHYVEHIRTPIGLQCYFGEDPGLAVPLKKGSMVAFHSLLMHRSGPNTSNSIRKAFVIQYSQECEVARATGEPTNNGPIIARGGKLFDSLKQGLG